MLLKLRVAFGHEYYVHQAIEWPGRLVAPRLLVSIFQDINRWALEEQGEEALAVAAVVPITDDTPA